MTMLLQLGVNIKQVLHPRLLGMGPTHACGTVFLKSNSRERTNLVSKNLPATSVSSWIGNHGLLHTCMYKGDNTHSALVK